MAEVQNLITENLDIWSAAIKKKSATGRGSNSKHELTGIKKLRELILELAIRGKIVPQDPDDEPASVLLEKIAIERKRLISEKKIKKTKTLPDISNDDINFELPRGWAWSRIAEIAELNPKNDLNDECLTSFVPMPLITTNYDGSHSHEIREWSAIKKGYTHFADGDIAIAKITPCFENSKAAIFSNLKNGVGAGTTELHVARPIGDFINPFFTLLYLKAPQFLKVGETKMTGSAGQKRVPKDFFALNPMPIPPRQEQQRIVATVEKLMTLCNQLEQQTEESVQAHHTLVEVLLNTLTNSANAEEFQQNWQRIAEHFDTLFTTEHSVDQLKKTILQLAVMGKLVLQSPDDEPASVLLEKVATEKAQLIADKKIKKQKPLPEISEEEKPFELPESWEWCRFPELGELARGKSKHRPRNDPALYIDGNIPLVQTGDVSRANGVIKTYTALYNEQGLEQSLLWRKGTMCITIAANIADTGILDFDACFPDSVVGFLPMENSLNVKYFEFYVRTAKNHLEDFAPSTAQKNINLEILNQLIIPLPPLQEINRIVDKVTQLLLLCDQLKTHIQQSQVTKVNLAETLVKQDLN